MSKRTRFSAKTSVVTRCRTGPAIRRNGWRRSRRRWRRWRPTPSWPRRKSAASRPKNNSSEPNLEALVARGIDGYVAPGRAQHPTVANGKVGGPLTRLMRKKIDDGGFETPYRLRKQVVEPVFGQIKQARGFRQFLLRGVKKVRAEWAMICTTHNLLKLFTLA